MVHEQKTGMEWEKSDEQTMKGHEKKTEGGRPPGTNPCEGLV